MPEQVAQQGYAAIQGDGRPSVRTSIPKGPASSRSPLTSSRSSIVGVGVAGALLTAAAIACAIMMTGTAPAPATTQATVSAPSAIAQTSAVAPAMVPAPLGPAQAVAPVIDVAPALSPVAALTPAQPAPPPLNAPGQCEIGQMQQLALDVSATQRSEVGNVIRIFSGSYVSPPIVVTRSTQTVTFPAPAGSNGSARIMVEQRTVGGWTFDEEANGITTEVEQDIDAHRQLISLRWTTPRC
jgi:hypothetical protein